MTGQSGAQGQWMKLLFLAVATLELVYLSSRIQNLLLTGIKGMAGRAHFNVQVSTEGRAGDERIAAAAGNVYFVVFWVDICFHDKVLAD